MKKLHLAILTCCALLMSCGHSSHNHDHAKHEGHDHATHEGHDHATHEEHDHATHEATSTDDHSAHSDEIVMSEEKARNAGVKTGVAKKEPFRSVIPTSGHLIAAQGDEASVVANMSGVVSMPRPITEGMMVSKGMALFTISAEKLQDGDPVRKAKVEYDIAKEEYERAKNLLADKLVTQSAFNATKEKYETARIAYEAVSAGKSKSGTTVVSPIDGYIRSCNLRPGDYVNTGQLIADIAKNNRLYLQADLPLRHYKAMGEITSANFTTDYSDEVFSTSSLNGKILSVGKTVSDESAFIPVTFEIDYRGDLIAGSFVKVNLLCQERADVISLPITAITEEQGVNFVYVQDDATCYHKQEVTLGMNDGNRVEIVSGLHGGETVVTEGAIHVRLASASNSIPGHSHSH